MNINKNSIIFFKSRSTNDIYARSIKFRKILKKTIPVIVAIFFIFIFFWESFFTLNKIEEINKNPFLDKKLVEFAFSIPEELLIQKA